MSMFQKRKIIAKRKLLAHPGPFARISWVKTSVRTLETLEKQECWCGTSMTRRHGCPRLQGISGKLKAWAEFLFPNAVPLKRPSCPADILSNLRAFRQQRHRNQAWMSHAPPSSPWDTSRAHPPPSFFMCFVFIGVLFSLSCLFYNICTFEKPFFPEDY